MKEDAGADNGTLLEPFWDAVAQLIQELPTINRLITDLMN